MNNKLLHTRSAARVLGVVALLSVAACNGDSGGDDPSCEPGTEGCPCDNGACSAVLTCLSNVCVQGAAGSGGTGGSPPQGGSGGTNAGGTSTGGTGGQSVGGAGGNPAGGTGSGGATTGGSGGVSGSGGTTTGGTGGTGGGSCGDTQTDPMNCGQCGRVCKVTAYNLSNADCPPVNVEDQCCSGGECVPYLAECIEESDGFTTCEQYCGSIGETCVEGRCFFGNSTWVGWSVPEDCLTYEDVDSNINAACDATITWDTTRRAMRCCCTDTQP